MLSLRKEHDYTRHTCVVINAHVVSIMSSLLTLQALTAAIPLNQTLDLQLQKLPASSQPQVSHPVLTHNLAILLLVTIQ